jgi:hypothetical protein
MQRIAVSIVPLLCGIAATLPLILAPAASAQTPDQEEVPEIVAVVGAPFSAVGTQQTTRVTADGNRFIHTTTTRHYRDGQGSTRLERDLQSRVSSAASAAQPPRTLVTIYNKVTGEFDSLFPSARMATVMQRTVKRNVEAPADAMPEIFAHYGGMRIGPKQPGWSAPVSLGEKSIDGVHVVGTQKIYTMAAGSVGNEKAVTITVQQWSSTDLGVIVDKTMTASTGGQLHYQLQQILQAEPSADLFRVPANYKTNVIKISNGNVVTVGSAPSTTATTSTQQ